MIQASISDSRLTERLVKLTFILSFSLTLQLTAGEEFIRRSALKTPESIRKETNGVRFEEPNNPTSIEVKDQEELLGNQTQVSSSLVQEKTAAQSIEKLVDKNGTTKNQELAITVPTLSSGLTMPSEQNGIQVNHTTSEAPDIGEQPAFTHYVLNNVREFIKSLEPSTLEPQTITTDITTEITADMEKLFTGLCDPTIIACRTAPTKTINPEVKKQAFEKLRQLKPLFTKVYTTLEETIKNTDKNPEKQTVLRLLFQAFYGMDMDTTLLDSTQQILDKVKDKSDQEQEIIANYQKLLDSLNDPAILASRLVAQDLQITDVKLYAKDKLEELTSLFVKVRDELEHYTHTISDQSSTRDFEVLKENLNELAKKFYGISVQNLELLRVNENWQAQLKDAKDILQTAQSGLKKTKYSNKSELAGLINKFKTILTSLDKVTSSSGRLKLLASLKLALKKTALIQSKLKEKITETKKKLPSMNSQMLKNLFQADLDIQKQLALEAKQLIDAMLAKLPNTSTPDFESQISTEEAVQRLAEEINSQADELFEIVSIPSPRAAAS